jgi:predicted esterase
MSISRRCAFALLLLSCEKHAEPDSSSSSLPVNVPVPVPDSSPLPEDPVRIEQVAVPNDLRALALRGPHQHRYAIVYLHGMCVYPGYYVESFMQTASQRADLVAVQGTISCGGDNFLHTWSLDIPALDRRIDAAFVAAQIPQPQNIVLVGYSQGADRAEALVARFPQKYTAAILIASSSPPSPDHLKAARAVVLMAGTRDSQANMRAGLVALERAHIPSTFIPLPDAWHGHMGSEPEVSMGRALDFVERY